MKYPPDQQSSAQTVFIEMFPINRERIPNLSAYRLNTTGDTSKTSRIGGKLSYRLRRVFGGHWAWADGFIVTDAPQETDAIMQVVNTLWSEQGETFKNLRGVNAIPEWKPDERAIADFVARGLLSDKEKDIQDVLLKKEQDLGRAVVERVHDLRGWVVDNAPAVSVSISSRLVLRQDLKEYATQVPQEQLLGLQVADKTSSLKGELTGIVGTLATERPRLLLLTQREKMQQLLTSSPDSDLVVTISDGRNDYDYAISALRIILRIEYLYKFDIDPSKALAELRLEPGRRANIVKEVIGVLKEKTTFIEDAFNSKKRPDLFITTPYTTRVKFGDGSTALYSGSSIIKDLEKHKLYRVAERFKSGKPIRVGFLNALKDRYRTITTTTVWDSVEGYIRSLGFSIQKIGEATVAQPSRAELEPIINEFEKQNPDILVAFFRDDFSADDDDETAYYNFKSLTIGRGIPSQVIEASTLENRYSAQNIVLGILGKTGNIPYVLAEPLDFADVVVGIDIAREKKKRLSGSINATAIARIYLSDGDFLQYVIHDAPLEGETIPSSVLQALFPRTKFEGKRVVIQRDGYFRGDEKSALQDWAAKIGATFFLTEVIKTGSPRIYESTKKSGVVQAKKGHAFLVSGSEAIVVSTLLPFKNATPVPLRIRSDGAFPIKQAIEAVLAMTNLHYGSVRPPGLPVTIHYSDRIAQMALRGIKPRNLEGTIPFWL
ncbi:MAG: Piwi domain-containing protein [Aggregatilineales bacterium]